MAAVEAQFQARRGVVVGALVALVVVQALVEALVACQGEREVAAGQCCQ